MLGRTLRTALAATLILVLGMTGPGSAAPTGDGGGLLGILDLDTQMQIDDLFASEDPTILSSDPGTTRFGPFESETTDSGTCGPDWANDHVYRFFAVKLISQGVAGFNTYRVTEKFKQGTFAAMNSLSPGACDSSDGTPPGVVTDGITGTFQGYLVMTVTSNFFNPSATCPPPCFATGDFLVNAFGPVGAATRMDTAFSFHYIADDPSSLVFHEWRNASCTRGGNHGDIASATAPLPTGFTEVMVCP
jgi:hypothetical protein